MKKNELIKNFKTKIESSIGASSFIEISGNREFMISGCNSVEEYNSNEIKLITVLGNISIIGTDLKLSVFRNDILSVEGTITMIKLGDE